MGSELRPAHGLMFDRDSFVEMPLTSMSPVIVPVIVIGPDCFEYVGTAFNIAPNGLFVTARHVLDGRKGAFEIQANNPGSNIAVLWVGSGVGHDDVRDLLGGPIFVSAITKYQEPESDLALLRAGMLKDGKPFPMSVAPLSTRPPKAGELIARAGYPKPKAESDISTPEQRVVTVDQSLHVATGEILEVFEKRRDAVMLPFAGFQTEAVFESGMSGGPVFNQDGYVCGVISFSLAPDADYPSYTSYASLALSLYPLWIADGENSITVYELAKRGVVGTDNHFDRVQYIEQDGRSGVQILREESTDS